MKKRFILLLVMVTMFMALVGGFKTREESETFRIVAPDTSQTLVFNLMSLEHYSNSIKGQIVMNASSYVTGGFGTDDSAIMILKAIYINGNIAFTIDSVRVAVPGTMVVDTENDSLLGAERIQLTIEWRDTVDVDGTDTAITTVDIDLAHRWAH